MSKRHNNTSPQAINNSYSKETRGAMNTRKADQQQRTRISNSTPLNTHLGTYCNIWALANITLNLDILLNLHVKFNILLRLPKEC